jgi:hypothetical protein
MAGARQGPALVRGREHGLPAHITRPATQHLTQQIHARLVSETCQQCLAPFVTLMVTVPSDEPPCVS